MEVSLFSASYTIFIFDLRISYLLVIVCLVCATKTIGRNNNITKSNGRFFMGENFRQYRSLI